MIMVNYFLDEYLIVNIVSRLPVESVLRCRCVCKSWRALLHELYFIQIHTDRTLLQQQHIDDQSLVSLFMLVDLNVDLNSTCAPAPRDVEDYSLECHVQDYYYVKYDDGVSSSSSSSSSSKVINSRLLQYPSPPPTGLNNYYSPIIRWSVIGSINGLICLYGVHNRRLSATLKAVIIIYNPITKEYLNLPAVGDDDIKYGRFVAAIGFGYHPSTKEYKIVRIIHQGDGDDVPHPPPQRNDDNDSYDGWLHIYTLGSKGGGKWRIRKVGVPPVTYKGSLTAYPVAEGTNFNGAIYWRIFKSLTIVSFDLEDEKFRIIHLPHSVTSCLKILGGGERLCVVCLASDQPPFVEDIWANIWALNNNGDDQYSWSKEFSLPDWLGKGIKTYEPIALGTGAGRDRVVCLCSYDDTLDCRTRTFQRRSEFLISLDCRTKTFESLGDITTIEKAMWRFNVFCYTKSLVSLKALGEEDAKVLGTKAPTTKAHMMIKLFTSFLLHLFVDYS